MQLDPLADVAALVGPYHYVYNDPVNNTDVYPIYFAVGVDFRSGQYANINPKRQTINVMLSNRCRPKFLANPIQTTLSKN
jgi:CubicO group peptidase (beta-lactamase class C family)